jgi:hypothetical protein
MKQVFSKSFLTIFLGLGIFFGPATARPQVNDSQAPRLDVSGPSTREVNADSLVVTGQVTDNSGVALLEIRSDRFPGQAFGAVLSDNGNFSAEAPLALGKNVLQIIAKDSAGNRATKEITATFRLTALPLLAITEPVSGSYTLSDRINVRGLVRSTLSSNQIRLVLQDQVRFPVGSDGEYSFVLENIRLQPGLNHLVVRAESIAGSSSATVSVSLGQKDQADSKAPVIAVQWSSSNIYLASDEIQVSGTVSCPAGVASVTVNGKPATVVGRGSRVSFDAALRFSAIGSEQVQVRVVALDHDGRSSEKVFQLVHDDTPPVLQVLGLQTDPAVNDLTQTPYYLSGQVNEINLAGLVINGQHVQLEPGGQSDAWSFELGLPLVHNQTRILQIQAWDLAGNRTSKKYQLRLTSTLAVEIIRPQKGAKYTALGSTMDFELAVRIPGISSTDAVSASLDGAASRDLDVSGNVATGTLAVGVDDADHQVLVVVSDQSGTVLARAQRRFYVRDSSKTPFEILGQDPPDQSLGAEANVHIALSFNRPFDPQLLEVRVVETVHGQACQVPKAADITRLSAVKWVDLHRDQQPVPGGLSYLPGNTGVVFYADRDFAYGGTVYVEVRYGPEGHREEIARTSFKIRPLHTLLQGFVVNHLMVSLSGIVVELPDLGRKTTTDAEGAFYFGYGEPVERTLPPGRYRLRVNPGQKSPYHGELEKWVHVVGERLNNAGMCVVPRLDFSEPYRFVSSGQTKVSLAKGELHLDLSQARLYFPDGKSSGPLYAQKLGFGQLSYSAMPPFFTEYAYILQPGKVQVRGPVGVSFHLPALNGNYSYLENMPKWVLMMGLDAETLLITPVGVGHVDQEKRQVVSDGTLRLSRLDVVGYSFVHPNLQKYLESHQKGEMDLNEMITAILSD